MTKNLLKKLDHNAGLLNMVVIPFLLLVFYYGLIASDRYVSQATYIIKENGANVSNLDIGLLGLGGTSGLEDEHVMEEYLVSADMLELLNKELGHKAHFQNNADGLSALSEDTTKEEYLEYYRKHVDVYFDDASGLMRIEVQAFERDYAKKLLEVMLQYAEDFVNDISHRLAMVQYEFVEQQLTKAKDTLKIAKQKLLAFQNQYQIYSPEQKGQSVSAILDGLEAELSQEQATLKQILGSQKISSPQVVVSKERIRALSEQIEDERQRLTGEGGMQINQLMAEYTNLQLDFEFAKDGYASALAALEYSRAEASKKVKHLVVVTKPTLADEAKYPDKSYILFTALVILLMLFGIVRMTISTIKEHQD